MKTLFELAQLLIDLKAANVTLSLTQNQLAWEAPKGAMTAPLKARLVEAKPAILHYLKTGALSLPSPPPSPHSPIRTRIAHEISSRTWLTPTQVNELEVLFDWHAYTTDHPTDIRQETAALNLVMNNIRLLDNSHQKRGAA